MSFKKRLIQIVTFVGGLYFFLGWLLPAQIGSIKLDAWDEQITNGLVTIGAMAIGLGLINLFSVHGARIIFKRSGWLNSLILLAGLFVMAIICALDWRASANNSTQAEVFFNLRDFSGAIEEDFKSNRTDVPAWNVRNVKLKEAATTQIGALESQLGNTDTSHIPGDAPAQGLIRFDLETLHEKAAAIRAALDAVPTEATAAAPDFSANKSVALLFSEIGVAYSDLLNQLYQFSHVKLTYVLLYDGLFTALGSAMFALLGFYIASAAYRAFRVKSFESGLMLGAALLVMLGQIPFGIWLWGALPEVRLWILEVPNSAAFRAVKIGASIAGLIMAFRMWLSIESDSFSGSSK